VGARRQGGFRPQQVLGELIENVFDDDAVQLPPDRMNSPSYFCRWPGPSVTRLTRLSPLIHLFSMYGDFPSER